MKIIERTDYLESLQNVRLTPDIKVITGIRRAGKSELIRTYMEWLRKNDKKANIIFIDFTSLASEPLQEYHALHNYIEEQYKAKKNNYVFIDEVQMCAKFELAINSLHAMQKYDIYITGSNAFLLGSDLATLFTGRVMRTMVYPFSFAEYRTYFGPQEIQSQLDQYIQDGGLAGSYVYSTQAEKVRYVQEVFHTIIERDIIQRYKLSDVYLLNKIAEYLMDNIGNTTSYRSVSGFLQSEQIKTNHVTVGNYMDFLCRTFLFNQVKRYDVRGKGYLRMIDKGGGPRAGCGCRFYTPCLWGLPCSMCRDISFLGGFVSPALWPHAALHSTPCAPMRLCLSFITNSGFRAACLPWPHPPSWLASLRFASVGSMAPVEVLDLCGLWGRMGCRPCTSWEGGCRVMWHSLCFTCAWRPWCAPSCGGASCRRPMPSTSGWTT